jgi:CRISPR-associated protein (TIGR02584 family)
LKTNILFAVVGKTPAVLTETLYALCVKEGIPIHEIEVIMTQSGKDLLRENGFFDRSSNPINKLFKDYKLTEKKKFDLPIFNEARVRIPAGLRKNDINSDENNYLMEAEITRRMRFLTSRNENYTVYASLSGGRKTMAAYMNLAMTVLGRKEDKLFHVLYEGPGGTTPKGWWYPSTKVKAEKNWINLFHVPFMHLREHLENFVPEVIFKDIPLSEITTVFTEPQLVVNVGSRREFILINDESLKAEPRSLIWLAVLAWRKKNIELNYEMTTNNLSEFSFSNAEKDLISKCQKTLRPNDEIDEKFFEKIKEPTHWASAATRLNFKLKSQFRKNYSFLNCYGGKEPRGAAVRCHFIKLSRKNIKII